MMIQRTNIFNSTTEGEIHHCSKCKKELRVNGIKLIQKKRNKFEIVLKLRCSYDCEGSIDQAYGLKEKLTKEKEEKEKTLGDKLEEALQEEEEVIVEVIDIKPTEIQTANTAEGEIIKIPLTPKAPKDKRLVTEPLLDGLAKEIVEEIEEKEEEKE